MAWLSQKKRILWSLQQWPPGEGCCHDGKQLLPLDRLSGREQLVWLPGVVEPTALIVCTTAKGTRSIGVEVDVVCWVAFRFKKQAEPF